MTEHANEADLAEQNASVDGTTGGPDEPVVSPSEANEADVLEQGAIVREDDDAYPRED